MDTLPFPIPPVLADAARYPVILADPPWQGYDTNHWRLRRNGLSAPRDYYPTMPLVEIAALPIPALAAADCALFVWTTGYLLAETIGIIRGWGFRYAGVAFVWVKVDKRYHLPVLGLGQYTRNNAEYCLLGIKGKPRRQDKGVSSVILARRREHSRKPDEQYERIMRLFPEGPHLELFARTQWPGWAVWGNETDLFAAQPFLSAARTA